MQPGGRIGVVEPPTGYSRPGDPGAASARWRWVQAAIALVVLVAVSSAIALLEGSVLWGRAEMHAPPGTFDAVPGRWLFAAGAVLVPSLVLLCTVLPWTLIVLAREVDQKARTQLELQDTHAMLERAEQMAQVGHWRIRPAGPGPRMEWSDSFFRILGCPPRSFEPSVERLYESHHLDDGAALREAIEHMWETSEPFHLELRVIRRDGDVRTLVTQGVAECDRSGRVSSIFGVVQDVSEARERDAQLREQAERLQVITDGMSDGVVMLDDQRIVRFWNPAAVELFGVAADHALGREFDELVELEDAKAGSTTLDLLPKSDRPDVERVESVDPRGRVRTLEITHDKLLAGAAHKLMMIRDVTRRAETERELQRRARFDELTGLLNRAYFWRRASQELDHARDEGKPLTLLLLDIDHFKAVNDARGHAEGDLALARFARCCDGRFRATDLVGRIGGEEFAVLLVGADAPRATVAAEKLRLAVESMVIDGQTGRFGVTASIGLAEMDLDDAAPIDDAARRADEALYRAKNEGRNRIHVAPLVGRRRAIGGEEARG